MNKCIFFFAVFMLFMSCDKADDIESNEEVEDTFEVVDDNATDPTQNLLKNLKEIGEKGTMFGHQDATLYGVNWSDEPDRSDIKSVAGDNPAVYGWDIANIELGESHNIDGQSFSDIREHIIAAYDRGGVNTIGWHTSNPVTGGDSWDNTSAVYSILPGGENHQKYKGWLDKVAEFMLSLEGSDGKLIPILFRPFHEHTGSGFWWGKGNTSAADYISLWHFTIEYLRDTKNVHNMLYIYSPDIINSQAQYLEFWPGDEYVDILGLDAYDRPSWDYGQRGLQMVRLVLSISRAKNKPMAFTETGLENNTMEADWWTEKLLHIIENKPVAYVLLWRNSSPYHFFGPYPGAVSEEDFIQFADDPGVLLESDIPNMYE